MPTRRVYPVLFTVVFSVFMICGTAAAAAVTYELSPSSTFEQGCAGSCKCPVVIVGQIKGTFELTPLRPNPLFSQYRVTNILWNVVDRRGQVVHKITGSGIYQVSDDSTQSTPTRLHQLILDLKIDRALMFFDSGLIPDESKFPNISITVDRGTECYDIWLDLVANPIK